MIDTGASFSLTPYLEDFVTPLEKPEIDEMHGLTDSVKVQGVGWVEWTIRDYFGQVALIWTQAYYIPQAPVCLHSSCLHFI